jgi:hypothetical protein
LALRLATDSPLAILLQQFFSFQQSSLQFISPFSNLPPALSLQQFIFPSAILFPLAILFPSKSLPRHKAKSQKQKPQTKSPKAKNP